MKEIIDEGAVRLTLLAAADPIDSLYGCLKDLPRDPLVDVEAEHRAEIEADERGQDSRLAVSRVVAQDSETNRAGSTS